MGMTTLTYRVSFNTPAFLGNAEQNGQWRTPPFKAQLRQWWRVAYAASQNFRPDLVAMRDAEGKLFGHAWLEKDRDIQGKQIAARKSEVRIRLGQWTEGRIKSWEGLEQSKVKHPEAEKSNCQVGPHAYLAYGPLDGRGGTKFSEKVNAAIHAGEHTTLSLAFPAESGKLIHEALSLMASFGTVGGRGRNGWGSFCLQPVVGTTALSAALPLRPWRDALALDWPHAIGQDDKGALIWQTQPLADWKLLMKELAVLKIELRTQRPFKFPQAKPDGQIHDRHWLSYPVTTHKVDDWNRSNLRLPNSLRFKVRKTPDGQLVGVIFHMPCLPPAAFNPRLEMIERVWRQVHAFLDGQTQLTRAKD